MAEFVADMAVHLENASLGTRAATSGWAIFHDGLDDTPDTSISIQGYGAGAPSQGQFGDDALKYESPRAQVLVRAGKEDQATARTKAYAIYKSLGAIVAETVNGTFYHRVRCLQPPFLLKPGGTARPIFAMNIEGEKEVAA